MSEGTVKERFASVTPAGCYHAVESPESMPGRERLRGLLRSPVTSTGDDGVPAEELAALAEAGLIEWRDEIERLPEGTLSDLLPTLLPALSSSGRVVLTESRQGLFLDYTGVSREEAEELAVLASGLRETADRRASPLIGRFGIESRAFAIVDPAGGSEIGFWPLHVGDNVFTLTILGIPLLNSRAFRTLVWVLTERYGRSGVDPDP